MRDLESLLLNERLAHGGQPVLTMCMTNAVVTQDGAGNRKLEKNKARGKIDGAVALTMATSVAGVAIDEEKQDLDDFINNMVVLV